ncbi:excalibur calcium-binding domain-containing protein [Priestia megaterium]|uniref:excalibur calcium-binding domain-containing protein n=1 Tax=Priestia megaterium TaxID=1404 RepID=UPI001E2BDFE2|nr:excalibur calcium-binding domain-containing protein [Priestia megaterium]
MKRSIICILILFILTFLLGSCETGSHDVSGTNLKKENSNKTTEELNEEKQTSDIEKKASKETILADIKSVLKNEAPANYSLIEYKPIYFTGQKFPEVYVLYRPETASEGESTINIVRVFKYDMGEGKWKSIYNQSLENRMQLSVGKAMSLTHDKRQQVIVGVHEGSGAYFSYLLLGSKDGEKISALLDSFNNEDGTYFQGNYRIIKDKYLVFYESDRVASVYQWRESSLEKVDPSTVPELSSSVTFSDKGSNDDIDEIVVNYRINENQQIEANVQRQGTILGKVGQRISLVREGANTSDVSTRILYSPQNDPYSIDSETGEILAADIITVTIIPNGYDWEKAFEVYINAQDDTVVVPQLNDAMESDTDVDTDNNTDLDIIDDNEDDYNNNIVGDADCPDFATQPEAQAFFEAAGPGDPHDLDRDGDGMACDAN